MDQSASTANPGGGSIEARGKQFRSYFSLLFLAGVIGISAISLFQKDSPGSEAVNDVLVVDELWVLVCAALVFFMQAGFLCFEVGLARTEHTAPVAIKNIVDWAISSFAFVCIGFGLMFGTSAFGSFGTSFFALGGIFEAASTVSGPTFFVFQLAFAGTAITIVSGSLVERTTLLAYGTIAAALGLVIYPVYGHWVWGNLLVTDNQPWLVALGFHDFAGGTVVHLLGATVALVGIIMIGPRIGRFSADGSAKEMPASNIGLSLLGVMILWFGWWGFNGGSFLSFGRPAITAIIWTNLAAVSGLVGAGLFAYLFQNRYLLSNKLVAGAIGGLVAITPGADVMTLQGSIAIGLLAGMAVSWSTDYLLRLGIDDALGIVPVHGAAAIVGTLGLAVFGAEGSFDNSVINQVFVQFLGIIVCISWAAVASIPVYWTIKRLVGLRVSPMEELQGPTLDNNEWPYQVEGASVGAAATAEELVGAVRDRD